MKWSTQRLGELCDVLDSRRKPITQRDREPGPYPYYGATGILDSVKDYIFDEKLVLIGEDGAKWGANERSAFIAEGRYWVNNHAHVIRPNRKEVMDEWLVYYLNYADLSPFISGLTVPKLNQGQMREIPVPVAPLPEQQRIVTKLDAAFAALAEAQAHVERNRANARELFESYLNGVFRNAAEERKEGWQETTLGELGRVCMCKRILKEQTTATGDIPFYKIGTFGKAPNAFIPREIYEEFRRKYPFPKKGDVLISASGTIGRGVVYDGEPAYFQDSNIVWIDNNEEQVLNEYLFQFYRVCDWNPTKGATISRLYNDDLRKVRISFPSIPEQRKIVAQMIELDAQTQQLETTYQQKLMELAGLKKGLLGAAFSGEL